MTTPVKIATLRNASLPDLIRVLEQEHATKLDVVAPARDLRAVGGHLRLNGIGEARLSEDGVTVPSVMLRPTALADAAIADKLRIPGPYLRRMRTEHLGLWDDNVNGWLDTAPASKRFLVRGLADGHGGGVLRGFLSDSYRIIDHLDGLFAALQGIREAGAEVDIAHADLTESRMYVKVRSTAVAAMAPALLRNYVSPFTGARGADNPTVFAGFVITNSETGAGRSTIIPRLEVQVCDNGLVLDRHALGEVHLGGRLPEGHIRWSPDTQQASLALVSKQARDAVASFLDPNFVTRVLAEIERDAGVEVHQPAATLEHVASTLSFSTELRETILGHFIKGGDLTSGGVLHAVTSAAQTLPDADIAFDLERQGLRAMSLAAAHASA